MCRKFTTWDPRLYIPSEGIRTQDFYALKKSIDPGRDRTREPLYLGLVVQLPINRRDVTGVRIICDVTVYGYTLS